jgi:transposase
MATVIDKIREVGAVARVIVQHFGHTKKFAKHIVALVIKQEKNLRDYQLAEFLEKDPIGKMLGYKRKPHPSTFSKVRERADPRIFKEVYDWIVQDRLKGKQIHLFAQDSSDIPAQSKSDKDARWGHRTPSKREQEDLNEKTKVLGFGYKIHMIAAVEGEIPLGFCLEPANKHDKTLFAKLFGEVKNAFTFGYFAKYLADSAYDSTDIKEQLRECGIIPVISRNGRRWRKSETPKDPDYGKRWAIERIFSRLKEVFGMSKNRVVGLKKVSIHVFSCLLAYAVRYVM